MNIPELPERGRNAMAAAAGNPVTAALLAASLLPVTLHTAQAHAAFDWYFTDAGAEVGFGWAFELSEGPLTGPDMMSGGLAAADVDRDGWVDLYIPRGDARPGLLLINLGDGRFREADPDPGLPGTSPVPMSYATGAAFADLTGNGFPDLVLGGVRRYGLRLYLNDGGRFTPAGPEWGLTDLQDHWSVAFADVDGDGRLDLSAAHWNIDAPLGSRGGHLWLRTDAGFVDAGEAWGITPAFAAADYSFTPNFADINGDGRPDLLVAADFGTSQVFRNVDGVSFHRTTTAAISDENGMGAAIADFDGDGHPDWFVTSIWSEQYRADPEAGFSGNRLYRNNGDGTFSDATDHAGVREGHWGWGACAADFDNSGSVDLFHVNGFLSADLQISRLFINDGSGRFTEQSGRRRIADPGQGRGLVCFDYDRDGDIDVFVANNHGPGRIYRNNAAASGNRWLGIRLQAPPPNTEAIGARVTVRAGDLVQVREMSIPNHFLSTGPAELHFGLGLAERVDSVDVRWPDGGIDRFHEPDIDRWVTLRQGCGGFEAISGGDRPDRRRALALRGCRAAPDRRSLLEGATQSGGSDGTRSMAPKFSATIQATNVR
ncbi:MAG: CRTAC1 family protein [Wenzhouxiangellaceae bacterium]|nr:CRTAC1 family protein [Wenzhouxiangellaceae bacterium]